MTQYLRNLGAFVTILVLTGCANGAWMGDKTYDPPEVDNVSLVGFNVDDDVAVLLSGALPITISRDIVNTGPGELSAGYTVREEVILTIIAVQGGAAAF